MSNSAFKRPAGNRFGGGQRGPIPVAGGPTPAVGSGTTGTIASIVDEIAGEEDMIASIIDEVADEDTTPDETDEGATLTPVPSTEENVPDTEPADEEASGDEAPGEETAAVTDITPDTVAEPATQDPSADSSEAPSEKSTATEPADAQPEQESEVTTPPSDNTAAEPTPSPTSDPVPAPEAAQAETPAPTAPTKKAAPKKPARKKASGTDTTEEVATKPLVVISDGKVHYLDSSVYVVNLDDARAVTDAHEVVDFLAGLAEVADSDGKTEVISNLTEILTEKALSR